MKKLFLSIFALGFLCAPAFAQEGSVNPSSAPAGAKAPTNKELEEMQTKLRAKLETMSKDMSDQEKSHFQTSYNNYILINMVKTVQKDVGEAVNACGAANPDMKTKMADRFAKWNDAVNPVLKDSQGNLDNMVLAQDYASKDDMQDVFNYIDKTREISRAQFERVPVTTPEACQNLHDKMDETQENLVRILGQTLVTFPKLNPSSNDAKSE